MTSYPEETMKLNRVLLEGLPAFREYTTSEGLKVFSVDGSALPFIVEELIALSAVQVQVPGMRQRDTCCSTRS